MTFFVFFCCLILSFAGNVAFFMRSRNDATEPELTTIKWNDLKVRFGLPFKRHFNSRPRTATEALSQGYTKISECDSSSSAKWRGVRYVKNDDFSLILLYDVTGYIAGVQTTVPTNQRNGFPQAALRPPFVEDGPDRLVITAYFVDPAIICTSGRSSQDFNDQGTGTGLYFQNGTVPESNSFLVPRRETDVSGTKWGRGNCFYAMGVHYWYDLSRDMDCGDVFPVFLLYNKGQLTGFGWALVTYLRSPNYEHFSWPVFPLVIKPVPRCLPFQGFVTSQHIYFTDDVREWDCKGERFKSGK